MKIVISKTPNKKTIRVDKEQSSLTNLEKAVSRVNRAFEQIKESVFERTDEITAIRLAILIREHVMLEGKWGIAKSRLAREVFRRITGSKCYRKLLMKGTSPDEVFGPMNSKAYRERAVWEHNTTGFLPEANFAFLDEVYRASDSLLGSLLGVLNEREFQNGTDTMNCPLITAIGTTNFTIDSEELEAFHDRWLIKMNVKPLSSSSARLSMLRTIIAAEDDEEMVETFSLDDVKLIQEYLPEIEFSDELIELFHELCMVTIRQMPGPPYVSDRRIAQTARLVLGGCILDNRNTVLTEDLWNARFGLCVVGDNRMTDVFDTSYEKVVGDHARYEEELRLYSKTQRWVKTMLDAYAIRADLETDKLVTLYENCLTGRRSIESTLDEDTDGEKLTSAKIITGYKNIVSTLSTIIETLKQNKKVAKTVQEIQAKTGAAAKVQAAMGKIEDGQEIDGYTEPSRTFQ